MKITKSIGCYIMLIFFWCLITNTAFAAKNNKLIWAVGSKIPTMDIYATTSLNLTNIYSMVSTLLLKGILKTSLLNQDLLKPGTGLMKRPGNLNFIQISNTKMAIHLHLKPYGILLWIEY